MRSSSYATVGTIAQRLQEPIHRVEYVIRTRNIQPEAWAGNCRVFSEAAERRIAAELRRMDRECDEAAWHVSAADEGREIDD